MHNVRIHRQNRRSLVMKRTPVGLVVFIPRWLKPDSPKVRAFIEAGIEKLGTPAPTVERVSAEGHPCDGLVLGGAYRRPAGARAGA